MNEALIQKQMKCLGISREEAIALIAEDMEIDKMSMKEVQNDLTADQKKAIKKATATGERKRTVYKFDTAKKRPKDEEKVSLVKKLFDFVKEFTENCEITNEAKEISFSFNGGSYSLTLTKHRNKKEK